MRSTRDANKCVCLFIDDLPGGGCLVSTPDGDMSTSDMGGSDEPFYLKDGTELFYPGWAEW